MPQPRITPYRRETAMRHAAVNPLAIAARGQWLPDNDVPIEWPSLTEMPPDFCPLWRALLFLRANDPLESECPDQLGSPPSVREVFWNHVFQQHLHATDSFWTFPSYQIAARGRNVSWKSTHSGCVGANGPVPWQSRQTGCHIQPVPASRTEASRLRQQAVAAAVLRPPQWPREHLPGP